MSGENKIKKPLGVARLIPGKCIACGARCQAECPRDAIEMDNEGRPGINIEKCSGCQRCVKICPANALEMYFTPDELRVLAEIKSAKEAASEAPATVLAQTGMGSPVLAGLTEYRGVWVFVEQTGCQPAQVSWELLGAGMELARSRGVELCSIVIGDQVKNLCYESFTYGASKAYFMEHPVFHYYRTEPYYKAICYLVNKYKPEIMLIGATGLGRDLAGAVATSLGTGLTADCTGLAIDERGFLLQTRPAFGGNIMATILTERTRPQMATVRPHVMPMPAKDSSRRGEIVCESLLLPEEDLLVKVLQVIEESREGADISGAEVIVSGGRGMQNKENFHVLQELAVELGGVVGCSRGAVEAGWMPPECQVGQTGKTVRPKIYFACGISGAIQHLVGMQQSDIIIAINRDPHAPIFEVATYGIVGDVLHIVPAITRRIRQLREQRKKESR
jgi:electron transfer flavoprotein alpha subunit